MILALIVGVTWRYVSQKRLVIDVNGSMQEIHTHTNTVGEALDEANIVIDPADQVSPALDSPIRSGMTIVINKPQQLVLEMGGKVTRVYTHALEPLVILAEQGIILRPGDQLFVNQRPVDWQNLPASTAIPNHLRIIHAKAFQLYDEGQLIAETVTAAADVGQLLDEYNVLLYIADDVVPPLDTPISEDMVINVTRSSPIVIRVDDRVVSSRVIATNVGEVLNRLGFGLSGQDYSIPDENALFVAGMTIEIVRVVETIEVEQESLPFETITVFDPALPPDQQQVVQEGVNGVQETRIRVRRENDLIVSRVVQFTGVAVAPIPRIIAYGNPNIPVQP